MVWIIFLCFPSSVFHHVSIFALAFIIVCSHGTDFYSQVRFLASIQHRNLVTLLGYCQENNLQFLIYEYIPNGSVSIHLYGNSLSTQKFAFMSILFYGIELKLS